MSSDALVNPIVIFANEIEFLLSAAAYFFRIAVAASITANLVAGKLASPPIFDASKNLFTAKKAINLLHQT